MFASAQSHITKITFYSLFCLKIPDLKSNQSNHELKNMKMRNDKKTD